METKICYHCQELKSIEEFRLEKISYFLKKEQRVLVKELRRSVCRKCKNEEAKVYRMRNYKTLKQVNAHK